MALYCRVMIGIIDYGMGNLRSVQKAFEHVGSDARILQSPDDLTGIEKLILPGVGAFADGMTHLNERGWIAPIKDFADSGKPLLGICLGMQLMFDGSQEDAPSPDELVPGLALLPGEVLQFQITELAAEAGVNPGRMKVPHMGWNSINWKREDPLLAGLDQGCYVYFVHGYYVTVAEASDKPVASASCDYGGNFCASIWRDNLWATQFHPEKSQGVGLKMLTNFAAI
jgi:glutamine amidotransferase